MDEQNAVRVPATKSVRAQRGRWAAGPRAQIVSESLAAGATVQSVADRHGIVIELAAQAACEVGESD